MLLEKQRLNLLHGTIVSEANFSWDPKLLVQGSHISKYNCDWRETSSWAYLVVFTLWSAVPQAVCRLALKSFLRGEQNNLVGLNSLWMSFPPALQKVRFETHLLRNCLKALWNNKVFSLLVFLRPGTSWHIRHSKGLINKGSAQRSSWALLGGSCSPPALLGQQYLCPPAVPTLLFISCCQTASLCRTGCFRTAFPPLPSPISSSTQTFDIHLCIKEGLFTFLACFHLSA